METAETEIRQEAEELSLWSFSIAGVIAGLAAGILNNIWITVFPLMTPYEELPALVDAMSVTILSFIPLVLAGFVYYFLCGKGIKRGTKIFVTAGIILLTVSLYIPLFPESISAYLGDDVNMDSFPTFTIPMHFITAGLAIFLIPWFVKKNH